MALAVAAGFASYASMGRAEDIDAISKKGTDLRRQGRDADALVEFQRAMKIQKTARIQAQVALAEQALGLWSVAEEDLAEALAQNGDPWIKKNRTALKSAFETIQTHLGTLEIWGTPDGSAVFVNEKLAGSLPLKKPVRVSGDSAVLRVRAEGYLESTRTVRIPAGQTVREFVELVPVIAAAVPAKNIGESNVVREPRVTTNDPNAEPRESQEMTGPSGKDPPAAKDQPSDGTTTSNRLRPFAWAAMAGSVGGLTLGVIETLVAINKKHAFNDHTGPNPADPGQLIQDCNTDNLSDACKPLLQAYNSSVTLAIVGYAVGGAFAIGSAVLFALSSHADSPSRSALACVPDTRAPGLTCQLIF